MKKKSSFPIVLLTDFGLADPFVGVIKGVILTDSPNTPIIDLSHSIRPQDIHQAGRMLFDNYFFFPTGSIFLCVVDPGVGGNRNILCLQNGGFFFIAPDNGLLSKFFSPNGTKSEFRLVATEQFSKNPSKTFHGRDIMAHLAARLSKSPSFFKQVGPVISSPQTLKWNFPQIKTNQIRGEVIDFDRFGNAITNIPAYLIRFHSKTIRIRIKQLQLTLVQYYEQNRKKPAALINSNNYVELFLYQASVQKGLKLKRGDTVIVTL